MILGAAGTLIDTLNISATEPLPCNAQGSGGTAIGEGYLVVPGLGIDHADPGPYLNGSVTIFNRSNDAVSTIEIARWLGIGASCTWFPSDLDRLALCKYRVL